MYHITLSKEIKQNCPEFRGAAVFAEVTNTPYCEGLWQEIATFTQELRARETTDSIKYQPVIAAKPTNVAARTPAATVPRPKH